MPIEYRIEPESRVIIETWSGAVSISDLDAYWRDYLADPEVLSLRRTVVDLRAATIAFTGPELLALVQRRVMPVLGDRTWTTAIVVERPVQFGVGRQYQAFAGQYSQDAIFNDIAAATSWVTAQ